MNPYISATVLAVNIKDLTSFPHTLTQDPAPLTEYNSGCVCVIVGRSGYLSLLQVFGQANNGSDIIPYNSVLKFSSNFQQIKEALLV